MPPLTPDDRELQPSEALLIEDLEIARIIRERTAAGPVTPLEETAAKLGIDLDTL